MLTYFFSALTYADALAPLIKPPPIARDHGGLESVGSGLSGHVWLSLNKDPLYCEAGGVKPLLVRNGSLGTEVRVVLRFAAPDNTPIAANPQSRPSARRYESFTLTPPRAEISQSTSAEFLK